MSAADESSRPRAALAAERTQGRLLHPGVLFTVLWAAVLITWFLIPESTFLRLTLSEKYVSMSALGFFVLAIAAFLGGTLLGPSMLRVNRPARLPASELSRDGLNALARGSELIFCVGAVASAYLILAGAQRAGGLSALLNQIADGRPFAQLAQDYFRPAEIALVTVWLHLTVAAAPLSVLTATLTTERAARVRQLAILALGLLLALAMSLVFAERLIAFAYVVSAAVAWVVARRAVRTRPGSRPSGRTVLRLTLIAALLIGFWLASEISRTYLATRETSGRVGVSDVKAGTPVAADRFMAYVIASANNGMYAVDHVRTRSYFASSLSAFVTAAGWTGTDAPIVGAGNAESERLLRELYPYGNPLTTFSLPGLAFMDIGWPGAIVLFWFGAGIAAVFARFRRGELWALAVYPLCVVGILDSYRIMYWTDTHMVVPLIGTALVMVSVYRAERASRAPRAVKAWRTA